ncbi:unnamed protein product [Rotaria sp. Silwood1]|nr:unnamed protein product [Rotaria sp. Silwood1]CAF1302293.1 unnamed protein product [Rotaria sp. Silwood1]
MYCRITYRTPSALIQQLDAHSQATPNKRIPEYVRNVTVTMRLKLITTSMAKINCIWHFKFLLLQLATFIEYILNESNPNALFHALGDSFSKVYDLPYFVFDHGIGVGSYELVKRYIQDIPPCNGFESLGWNVSSSQQTFCDLTTVFLSSDNPNMKLSRHIIFQWLHAFPHHLFKADSEARLHLSRIVPRRIDEQPSKYSVYQAISEVIFFLATDGELRKNERVAFINCVEKPFIFFPNWFNFLLFGYYLKRKILQSYYTLLQAFARHIDGPELRATFTAADNQKSKSEVLKLITIVFYVAGSIHLRLLGQGDRIMSYSEVRYITRTIAIQPTEDYMYVGIGSASNIDIESLLLGSIQVANFDGTNQKTFVTGLRNVVGLAFYPIPHDLCASCQERDELADDLVPDSFYTCART